MELNGFDPAAFLRDYWQKKPLLIRQAFAEWHNPLEPDELAGLACEPGVESRLVTQADGAWQLEHGPLPEDRFDALGTAPWTLLVQAVDHHVPEVVALLEAFRFVPNWRVDDVMVSYATNTGGVGPHFDQYDVFLVQGLGRRRWRIGGRCDGSSPLLPHDDLRLLAEFETVEEWVLEPGDMLYVPPGVAHDGIAVGHDCMTYSIGFRAPSAGELIEGWADHLADTLDDGDRYADPDLAVQANPGEIAPEALARLRATVLERLSDPAAFARWFGTYATARKSHELDWQPDEEPELAAVRERAAVGVPLVRNPASRFAFVRQGAEAVTLFVDAQAFDCTGAAAAFAEALCAADAVAIEPEWLDESAGLILDLLAQGSVAFDAED